MGQSQKTTPPRSQGARDARPAAALRPGGTVATDDRAGQHLRRRRRRLYHEAAAQGRVEKRQARAPVAPDARGPAEGVPRPPGQPDRCESRLRGLRAHLGRKIRDRPAHPRPRPRSDRLRPRARGHSPEPGDMVGVAQDQARRPLADETRPQDRRARPSRQPRGDALAGRSQAGREARKGRRHVSAGAYLRHPDWPARFRGAQGEMGKSSTSSPERSPSCGASTRLAGKREPLSLFRCRRRR